MDDTSTKKVAIGYAILFAVVCGAVMFLGGVFTERWLLASLSNPPDANNSQNSGNHEPSNLEATFIGQDGANHAGRQCSSGTRNDNVHIRVSGLRDKKIVGYRLTEPKGGVWATPCDPVSNWFLYVTPSKSGKAELYFKPYRNASQGTVYTLVVYYSDGKEDKIDIIGQDVVDQGE